MIFGKTRLELKVGVFVFFGVVILAVFVVLIGNFKTLLLSHRVEFLFNFTNGIKTGAPVRYSGVDIGEVKQLEFIPPGGADPARIRIVGWIRSDIKIPADSSVWINTLGLLGEKYIEIMPGTDTTRFVKKNDKLRGEDPMAMHEVTNLIKGLVEDLDESVKQLKSKEGTLGKLLYDDTLHTEVVATVKDTQEAITRITAELEALLIDIKAHPWKLFFKPKEKASSR